MDAITLLNEFAQSKGISEKEVREFLSKYDNPQTLEDLFKLPHDMLQHEKYISWVAEPLQTFISDHLAYDRHETIDLSQISDKFEDMIDNAEDEYGEDSEEYKQVLKEIDEVEKCIIKNKFGSVVYDW